MMFQYATTKYTNYFGKIQERKKDLPSAGLDTYSSGAGIRGTNFITFNLNRDNADCYSGIFCIETLWNSPIISHVTIARCQQPFNDYIIEYDGTKKLYTFRTGFKWLPNTVSITVHGTTDCKLHMRGYAGTYLETMIDIFAVHTYKTLFDERTKILELPAKIINYIIISPAPNTIEIQLDPKVAPQRYTKMLCNRIWKELRHLKGNEFIEIEEDAVIIPFVDHLNNPRSYGVEMVYGKYFNLQLDPLIPSTITFGYADLTKIDNGIMYSAYPFVLKKIPQ